ncbi:YihY/virulence factor BrkB family protein [Devosia sediminis]|uniref:YihY/virulence factor BrkB family protein n=1 Tax=Devosia sediminis TaxID=2798801 RepID=A0A934IQZ7_9HYPH|nr:YihY/virulence factor BrkB family protein [Devosia sediminis]MBJ3783576.1 YihY/virulence factor BrkB family protein [Devosia sediminis]
MTADISSTASSDSLSRPRPTFRLRRVVWRTILSMTRMETAMNCAGIAYFGFLSLFPAAAAVITLVGLLMPVGSMADMVTRLEGIVPDVALRVIAQQLVQLSAQPNTGLGIGLALSLAIACWSGSRGIAALMFAISRTHATEDKRNIVVAIAMSVLVTLLAGLAMLVVLALVAGLPALFAALPWVRADQSLLLAARWPLLLVLGVGGIAAFYRFAPDRKFKRARWIWPGALLATSLWLAACAIFSFYVEQIGNFEASFGSLATAIVLLLWMYNSALFVVLGAIFNSELQREAQRRASLTL